MTERIDLLVLGLGNILCTDDGAGVAAVARLQRRFDSPPGVRVADGGTLGLALLPLLQTSRRAILVDAVRTNDPPGTLLRLEGDDVLHATATKLSPHQIGVADLLDGHGLLGGGPESIVLIGIVPESIALGVIRSASVEAHIDDLVSAVIDEAARQGARFVPRVACHARERYAGEPALDDILGVAPREGA